MPIARLASISITPPPPVWASRERLCAAAVEGLQHDQPAYQRRYESVSLLAAAKRLALKQHTYSAPRFARQRLLNCLLARLYFGLDRYGHFYASVPPLPDGKHCA